ncbi:MAG: hypothetical protein LBC41_01430 [Clostridiales bacterium]|jgi:hypothetical protein|nr:hypothetical protein [Clostridiales bacterium]MDR2749296.1 hypothetical protein [Clostridiales bacterium]
MYEPDNYNSNSPPPPPPPPPRAPDIEPGALTLREWLVTIVIQIIPCINIIFLLLWAFGPDNPPSRKTYAKAWLIVMACSLLFILFFARPVINFLENLLWLSM